MTILAPFPDIESVILDLLEVVSDDVSVDVTPGVGTLYGGSGTVTMSTLQGALPYVRVNRIPGGGGDLITDISSIRVDVFTDANAVGGGIAQAKEIAELIRQTLISGPNFPIDVATCTSPPVEIPWGQGIRRVSATYRVSARRTN